MTNYFEREKEKLARMRAETIHEQHVIDYKKMCNQMIQDAFREHDQQIQVDVVTTLNGKPTTMRGLIEDVRKQIYASLRKAFK